jgi:rSAM/selenodomain-associated transferase 2
MISVIIPTLNEETCLPKLLERLVSMPQVTEIIVADGGSSDKTLEIAARFPVIVVSSERGRGTQQNKGALAATNEILWFVHADTVPQIEVGVKILEALRGPGNIGGNLKIIFDGNTLSAKFLTWLYPALGLLGLKYGDSGIFLKKNVYFAAEGFSPIPLFEDVELVRKASKFGNFLQLQAVVEASSRRFQNKWFIIIFIRWSLMQGLYWLGVSPRWLAKYYHNIR